MKAIMLMFDSLNRHMLPPYGGDWIHAPNFRRLAARTATFERSYVCSMPCMPARRDLHTGRPNFLHRAWGPLEPFDNSVPEMLKTAGVYTHLSSDHPHYWEDGGCTYHPRYNTWDFSRGQEGDPWIGQVCPPALAPTAFGPSTKKGLQLQDAINRLHTDRPETFPMNLTFKNGLEFIQRNRDTDNWFLQIETFDPHEPFVSLAEHKKPYAEHYDNYTGKPADWPPYREVRESRDAVEHTRHDYAALVTACDAKLGELLDTFDELNLWKDTMLIVWTDHGFLLGEHDCWAKCWTHFYDEIAHTPFFLWDPRHPAAAGTRRQALVQPAIDLGPTLLKFFGLEPAAEMLGHDLAATIARDEPVREHAIFGVFGGHVNITDGRHVYMRAPVSGSSPLFNYTLMPTHMRSMFSPAELTDAELAPPFDFTKNCPVLKVPVSPRGDALPSRLFDLETDPGQLHPLTAPRLENKLAAALATELRRASAPAEQFDRLGLASFNRPTRQTPEVSLIH
jgi:arylsulfatase A-like enzyme